MIDWGFTRPILNKPLTLANTDQYGGVSGMAWHGTEIGQLFIENKVNIDLLTVPDSEEYAYRVADAWWIDEDTQMARFRCYGPEGEPHPWASVIVNNTKMPIDNIIWTGVGGRSTAAYIASTTYKSELITFGTWTESTIGPHTTLCVCWQLFPEAQYRQMKADGIYR